MVLREPHDTWIKAHQIFLKIELCLIQHITSPKSIWDSAVCSLGIIWGQRRHCRVFLYKEKFWGASCPCGVTGGSQGFSRRPRPVAGRGQDPRRVEGAGGSGGGWRGAPEGRCLSGSVPHVGTRTPSRSAAPGLEGQRGRGWTRCRRVFLSSPRPAAAQGLGRGLPRAGPAASWAGRGGTARGSGCSPRRTEEPHRIQAHGPCPAAAHTENKGYAPSLEAPCHARGCKTHLVCCSGRPCCSVTLIPQPLAPAPEAPLCSSQIKLENRLSASWMRCFTGGRDLWLSGFAGPRDEQCLQPKPFLSSKARRCDCQRPCWRVVLLPRPECDPHMGAQSCCAYILPASLFSVWHLPLQDV